MWEPTRKIRCGRKPLAALFLRHIIQFVASSGTQPAAPTISQAGATLGSTAGYSYRGTSNGVLIVGQPSWNYDPLR
ncbi:MAG: hypothetical protein U0X76_06920 [Bacteroidia bacterium]